MNRYLVLFCLLFFSIKVSVAQAPSGYVRFMGKVLGDSEPLSGAKIEVFKDSVLVDGLISTSSGKFDFQLDYNFIFIMEFSKHGCGKKTVTLDTHVPEKEKSMINYYEFNLDLFVQDSLHSKLTKVPSAVISFNRSKESFSYDESVYYNLGVDKFSLREFEDAINCFSISINLKYRLEESYFNRRACYKNVGNVKSACMDWQKVKELGSDNSEIMLINYCDGIIDSIH